MKKELIQWFISLVVISLIVAIILFDAFLGGAGIFVETIIIALICVIMVLGVVL